jgi:hypothetical protein
MFFLTALVLFITAPPKHKVYLVEAQQVVTDKAKKIGTTNAKLSSLHPTTTNRKLKNTKQ